MDTKDPTVLPFQGVDAFNERTTREKRARPLTDLLNELRKSHEMAVGFVESINETLFDDAAVERRIRMDLYDHYREHCVQISDWPGEVRR